MSRSFASSMFKSFSRVPEWKESRCGLRRFSRDALCTFQEGGKRRGAKSIERADSHEAKRNDVDVITTLEQARFERDVKFVRALTAFRALCDKCIIGLYDSDRVTMQSIVEGLTDIEEACYLVVIMLDDYVGQPIFLSLRDAYDVGCYARSLS